MNRYSRIISCTARFNDGFIKRFHKFNSSEITHVIQDIVKTRYNQRREVAVETMTTTLQVIGTGACAGSKSVLLTTGASNLLFNCGENTLRIAYEHKKKVSKVSNIFFTSLQWNNVGGLVGILQTLKLLSTPKVCVHAPLGFSAIYQHTKNFLQLKQLKVDIRTWTHINTIDVGKISVTILPINAVHQSDDNHKSNYKYQTQRNGKRVIVDENVDRKKKKLQNSRDVICYSCKSKDIAGKLCFNKCLEMGVKVGPSLGLLKNGQDVCLADGRKIYHKDVCGPSTVGATILVIDCPTKDYLEPIINHLYFAKLQSSSKEEVNIACVAHFAPKEIINDPRYKDWMNKFSAETQHLIVNESNNCLGSLEVYKRQLELNIVHPEIFPLLKSHPSEEKPYDSDYPQICYPKTMHTFIWPTTGNVPGKQPCVCKPEVYTEQIMKIPGFANTLESVKKKIEDKIITLTNVEEYPKVVMLGTGSATPSKNRNVSAILIRIDEKHSILMDCGEGTYAQILRLFGEETHNILSTIKAIYISHSHTDHHMGLITIVQERAKVASDLLYLMAPVAVEIFIDEYSRNVEPILDNCRLLQNDHMLLDNNILPEEIKTEFFHALNIQDLNTVLVIHCVGSFGLAFTTKSGKKIVYSGDTMPCETLITLGKKCDLLIHEATMYDDLIDDAIKKRHSTVSQAINVGQRMEAKFTLLTHFSQRYPKLQILPNGEIPDNVGVALDNMIVNLSQLPLLPLLYPCLTILYKDS